jgi:hypothetical protein
MVELADALEEYAELEGSELGEFINALIRLSRYTDFMDAGFRASLEAEMQNNLDWLKDNTVIETVEKTVPYSFKELKFL